MIIYGVNAVVEGLRGGRVRAIRLAAFSDKTVEVLAWVSWEESAEKLKLAWPFVQRGMAPTGVF